MPKAFVVVVAFMVSVFASNAFAKDGYIVRLEKNTNPVIFGKMNNLHLKPISAGIGLYLATPKGIVQNAQSMMQNFRASPNVKYINPNHKVSPRTSPLEPNDKKFDKQWGYTLSNSVYGIDALTAWAVYGTGGVDKNNNEIVIAVVDGGFDITHPDIVNNLWVNHGEIANNGIDDDGNGYTDDVHGWDAESENGNIQFDYHGTHVSGTMGAEGNNGIAGTGVNWKIKIMFVSMGWSLADTDKTLASYEYIRKQKELWLQTGGQKGANVVAINSSFGIDIADCTSSEFSQWNDMIDHLGQVGILSIGATSNFEVDVDKHGDVPTSCSSDFLISVTNSTRSGEKESGIVWNPSKEPNPSNYGSGFGEKTIDLAAPGTDIYSIYPGDDFDSSTGTSMATPHVTGAVGYLYSVASPKFLEVAEKNPARAALAMKAAILDTVTQRQSLKYKTVSGGILNLFNASTKMANYTK